MIRHFIYLGSTWTKRAVIAFDGLNPHVAGARRGEFNHRFAQPSVQPTPSFGHLFPFAEQTRGSLRDRIRWIAGTSTR